MCCCLLLFGNSDEMLKGGIVLVEGSMEEEEVEWSSEVELEDSGKGVGTVDMPHSWMMKLRMLS